MPSTATVVVMVLDFFPLLFFLGADESATVSSTFASNPTSSIVSASWSGVMILLECSMTARSESRDMLKDLIPATSLNAPSTAEVQAPHVMPPTESVVVEKPSSASNASSSSSESLRKWSSVVCATGRSVDSTSASNPLSSMISLTSSADITSGSCEMTARSMTKLIDTFPTPATPWNPVSMAEVHAPQVMPSTFNVVVAMWAGALFAEAMAGDVCVCVCMCVFVVV